MDNASCPIVAGTPDVMKAAFTKEVDFFAHARHRVPRPGAVASPSRTLLARRMFETWGPRLGITEDENDHACREGLAGARGVRARPAGEGPRHPRDGRGRGPHRDPGARTARTTPIPGLNHGIPEEFQVLGYPIL